MAEDRWDFFIAYASPDRRAAETLHDLLSTVFRVFLDRRSLLPGDDWARRLSAAQDGAVQAGMELLVWRNPERMLLMLLPVFDAYARALELDPTALWAKEGLSNVFRRMGDIEEANRLPQSDSSRVQRLMELSRRQQQLLEQRRRLRA